ncbi:hypothetical protein DL991_39995 [Amycolatopsis sp. WAC 01375]|nr:hypothetical protein DL991_39995 [Amycolatopsis sp. WAC 01375]
MSRFSSIAKTARISDRLKQDKMTEKAYEKAHEPAIKKLAVKLETERGFRTFSPKRVHVGARDRWGRS